MPREILCDTINVIVEEWKLLLLITTLVALYAYHTSTFDHFEKRGVVYIKPKLLVGNFGKRLMCKASTAESTLEIYNMFKGNRFAGVFEARLPLLYILDPDLIKAVTIKDFDYFMNRNFKLPSMTRPACLQRILLALTGSAWKEVRSALKPTFSSARLKNMLPLMELCSKKMVDYLQKFEGRAIEMKETMCYLILEIIGATALGIKTNALSDEKSRFVKLAMQLIPAPPVTNKFLLSMFLMLLPSIAARPFNIPIPTTNLFAAASLVKMVRESKRQRELYGQRKNDFLQLLLDAAEKERNEAEKGKSIDINDDTIIAQCMLFLIAGLDTSSTLLAFAIHVLATKPDLQKKLRRHIEEVTEGKEMSFDLLSELTYLEGFLLETLRMYPPGVRVERVCTKNYVLPGTNVLVKEGETIAIPIYGIHMDPDIYGDPTAFKPERFIGDAKRKIPPHLFLAFGSGPRNCIGSRFAMMSAKQGIVHLLKSYEIKTCETTQDPVTFHKQYVTLTPENGIWVKFNKIKKIEG